MWHPCKAFSLPSELFQDPLLGILGALTATLSQAIKQGNKHNASSGPRLHPIDVQGWKNKLYYFFTLKKCFQGKSFEISYIAIYIQEHLMLEGLLKFQGQELSVQPSEADVTLTLNSHPLQTSRIKGDNWKACYKATLYNTFPSGFHPNLWRQG